MKNENISPLWFWLVNDTHLPLKVAPYFSDEGRNMFAVFTANEVQISFADSMYDTAFYNENDAKSAKDYIEDTLRNDAEQALRSV